MAVFDNLSVTLLTEVKGGKDTAQGAARVTLRFVPQP
jgi:hypothetical protein